MAINNDSIGRSGFGLVLLQHMACISGRNCSDEGLNGLESSFCFSFGWQGLQVAFRRSLKTEEGLIRIMRRIHEVGEGRYEGNQIMRGFGSDIVTLCGVHQYSKSARASDQPLARKPAKPAILG